MPRWSINQVTTYRWSFDEDLHHYRRAGFDGVGVWLRKVVDFGEERAVDLLSESGLVVSNLGWVGGFTGSDGWSAEDSLVEARRALRLAGAMRAGCLVVYAGGRNLHTQRNCQKLLRAALDALLPAAESARVPLALEPMHPACAAGWTFQTSLEAALELAREYDSPWLRLVYDSYQFPLPERDWSLLAEVAPHLAVVHLADADEAHSPEQRRCELGRGVLPVAGLVGALVDAGYDGFFDLELRGPSIEPAEYHRVVADAVRYCESLCPVERLV